MNIRRNSRYYEQLAQLCQRYDSEITTFTTSLTTADLQKTLAIPNWHGNSLLACALANLMNGTIVTIASPTHSQEYTVVQNHGLYFDSLGVHYAFELLESYRRRTERPDLQLETIKRSTLVGYKRTDQQRCECVLENLLIETLTINDTLKNLKPAA